MDQKFDVVGVGVCAVDYLGMIPSFPQPDTKTEMSELTMQGGGLVATALVTVSRLGGTAAYLGRVGDDAFGRFIVEEFEKEGVDTRGIALEPGGSAIFARRDATARSRSYASLGSRRVERRSPSA